MVPVIPCGRLSKRPAGSPGKEIKAVVEPRRGGDPSVLIASNKKAAEVLGWKPVLGLDQIISDAWAWHSGHPNGYEG